MKIQYSRHIQKNSIRQKKEKLKREYFLIRKIGTGKGWWEGEMGCTGGAESQKLQKFGI